MRPVFNVNDKGGLDPSKELVELATKLKIAHAVEERPRSSETRARIRISQRNSRSKKPLETPRARHNLDN